MPLAAVSVRAAVTLVPDGYTKTVLSLETGTYTLPSGSVATAKGAAFGMGSVRTGVAADAAVNCVTLDAVVLR